MPLVCVVPPTLTLAPVVVNVALRAVTLVPNGTVAVIDRPLIVAVTSVVSAGLFVDRNENAVMSLAGFAATVTVTVYPFEVPSAAVTVYITGAGKSLAVMSLTCAVPPTVTLAPVVENVAFRAVTLVPNGTVAAIAR